ncbi:hypothetical protein [Pseudomonas promysalinigenes]|uniref:Uncharacterized protein n=1 Tax=Pseudomonas promysalinigenes TaxID=485898 RepID=A0ABY6AIX8_9PSED|nr:hypothetical protein [Pseudomonas promysalinigenes]UXH38778.1 hypothetical protein N5C08_17620 [Pseudomonas promysalinigenes]
MTVVLGAGATSFIYQVGGDILDGRWSSKGVALYLHSVPLQRGEPVYFFYGSPSLANGERLIVPVELTAQNESEKVAKRVALSLRYPKSSGRHMIPDNIFRSTGSINSEDVTLDVNASDEFVYANHRISYMPPKDHVNIVDGAFSVSVARAGWSYLSLPSGLDIKASMSSESSASEDWELRYRAVSAENINQLRDWINFDYGQRLAREFREREGFLKYLWGWALSKKVSVFGFNPNYSYDPAEKVYFPKDNPKQYKLFRFSPYSRDLIFN